MASGTGATDTYFPPLNASKGSSCPQRASRKYFRTVTLLQSAAITYRVRTRGLGRGKGKQIQCKGEADWQRPGGKYSGLGGPAGCRRHRTAPRGCAECPSSSKQEWKGFAHALEPTVPGEKEAGKVSTNPCPVLPLRAHQGCGATRGQPALCPAPPNGGSPAEA